MWNATCLLQWLSTCCIYGFKDLIYFADRGMRSSSVEAYGTWWLGPIRNAPFKDCGETFRLGHVSEWIALDMQCCCLLDQSRPNSYVIMFLGILYSALLKRLHGVEKGWSRAGYGRIKFKQWITGGNGGHDISMSWPPLKWTVDRNK